MRAHGKQGSSQLVPELSLLLLLPARGPGEGELDQQPMQVLIEASRQAMDKQEFGAHILMLEILCTKVLLPNQNHQEAYGLGCELCNPFSWCLHKLRHKLKQKILWPMRSNSIKGMRPPVFTQ